jgi:hypothetical protein
MGEKEKTEQAAKPSEETEQAERPSDLHSAMELFAADQAKAAKEKPSAGDEEAQEDKTEEKQTESPGQEDVEETEEEAEEEEEEKGGEEPSPPAFKLVDEKGEIQPFVIKVDGKEVNIDSYDKLKTYAQLGYHGNQRLEQLNQKEKTLEQAAHMMEQIMAAAEEGRLVIKPPGSSKTGDAGKEQIQGEEEVSAIDEKDLELMDEDIKKHFKALNSRLQKLESENTNLKKMTLGKVISEAKAGLDESIGEAVEQYPYAKGKDKRIYQLLAEKDEKDEPRYSVDEAVKMVHEEVDTDIRQHVKNHPEYKKLSEKQQEEVIANYLKEKGDNESAPVNPPSEQPAGGATTKKKERKFQTMSEALRAFNEEVLKPKREAGMKH